MRRAWAISLVTCLLAGAHATRAYAQPSGSDVALATELFNAGRDLMKKGDMAAACPKLSESARLDPKVGTLASLADCEEARGQLALARSHWQQANNLARASGDPRAAHVEGELTRIDKIVPKLEMRLAGAPPAGLVLKIDEAQLGPASLGVKLPVDPGRHTIVASAPRKKPWSTQIETKADGGVSRVAVPALEDESLADGTAPRPANDESSPASSGASEFPWRTVGVVSAGVGLVGLGVGTVFGLIAKSKRDESNAQPGGCTGDDCPPSAAATRNDARSAGNLSTVFFVAGGVFAAAGVTIWLLAPTSDARRAARLTPGTGRDGASLSFEGAW